MCYVHHECDGHDDGVSRLNDEVHLLCRKTMSSLRKKLILNGLQLTSTFHQIRKEMSIQ